MINRIRGPIVAFKLRELEVRWDGLLNYLKKERRFDEKVGMMSRGDVAELFNPSVHLPQSVIKGVVLVADLGGFSATNGKDLL